MRQGKVWLLATVMIAVLATGCGNKASKEQCEKANQLVESAQKARHYDELMQLADSLEKEGSLTAATAYYWRGYASDRLDKKRMAEFYWKASIDNADREGDMDVYAKSASRLANLLTLRGDYAIALESAVPAAAKLEEMKCDSTSDYINLLIYIGCCQAGLGNNSEATEDGFDRAYQKHLANVENNRTDASYKDAIAGLINIVYACNTTQKYKEANDWIAKFGELLSQYQQRQGTDPGYVDKQLGRFNIYKAIALNGMGKEDEAKQVYDDYKETEFSKTPEGRITANDYLTAANRWVEAADNYRSLDALLGDKQKSYTLDDIESLVLKKYHANQMAGRRDSAVAVSLQISDALGKALAQEKQIQEEEQVTIVREVEQMIANQAKETRQRQMGLWAALGILVLCFLGYALYRRFANHQLKVAHMKLKADYDQLEEDTTIKERKETEVRISRQLQQYLQPKPLPDYKGLGIDVQQIPGNGIGSDLCDYLLKDDKLVFCIGSALEQEILTSLAAETARATFRAVAAFETDPGKMATAINKALTGQEALKAGVALFIGTLDLKTGKLAYCSAGHHAPLLLKDEVGTLATDECKPLGVDADYSYTTQETELAKGSMLFCFTDGLAAAENGDGKAFGAKMVRGTALQALKLNPQPRPFIQNIKEAIAKFTATTPQKSDITMLVVAR